MATRKLEPNEWQSYMDRISKHLPASTVDIRVDGLDIGDQVQSERLPLNGLTYDPSDGALEIDASRVQHRIANPTEIHVDEEGGSLRSIEVKDGEGHVQIIELTRALSLPAA
ncbi:MAG: DUF5335 domain-containing protein [Polyangiales bacterium]